MSKSHGPLRIGVGGPVGSGKTALMDALCKAMRRPDLAADPQLKTAHGRRQHEDMIEAEIAKWTRIVRPDSAMTKLQRVALRRSGRIF